MQPHHIKALLEGVYGGTRDIDFSKYQGFKSDFTEIFDVSNKAN